MREEKLYLADIVEAIDKIYRYTEGFSLEEFEGSEKTIDAVLRNFEVIGEAARNISERTKLASAFKATNHGRLLFQCAIC